MNNTTVEILRTKALDYCNHLRAFLKRVGADDGLSSARDWGQDVVTGSILKSKIDPWLEDESSSLHMFWAYTPDEEHTFSYSKALGLRFLWTVVETVDQLNVAASCMSHFCAVPSTVCKNLRIQRNPIGSRPLAMAYHLIIQFLKIDYKGHNKVQLNVTELQGLGEDIAHWNKALEVFGKILKQTNIIYCLITGLSDLEAESGRKCEEFLNVPFANTEPEKTWFMFTTCGKSPLFTKHVPKAYRCDANQVLNAPEAGEDQDLNV